MLKFIRAQSFTGGRRDLVERLFAETAAPLGVPPTPGAPIAAVSGDVTVPLRITVTASGADGRSIPDTKAAPSPEKISIDPDYADRAGYQPDFLGTGPLSVPLPSLSDELLRVAGVNEKATEEPRYLLPYNHYSAVMNKERRLAIFTVVNIDGALSRRLKREPDRWFFDPRIPENEQTGRDVYDHNDLDLGHLTRRLDPAWGDTAAEAKLANDDTFHFTNCTPQHKDFNRNKTSWAGLEDYILEHAENLKFKATIFNGPVLAPDDDDYRGVQLPRQFWKVAVMVKESGGLSATAYLLSQEALIKGLEIEPEAFEYGAYQTYQVKVSTIEELTGLSFGALSGADPLVTSEATTDVRTVERLEDVVV